MGEVNEMFDKIVGGADKNFSGPKDEIVVVVDRSGSMSSIRSDAEGGLNTFIAEQKKIPGGANFTLVEFDSTADILYDRVDLNEVGEYKLVPRGGTALYDALGEAINKIPSDVEGKVILVVVTDGDDNQSREYKVDTIKSLITEKQEAGWEVLFLAANQDAFSAGGGLGISGHTTTNFDYNSKGMKDAYTSTNLYAANCRSSVVASNTIKGIDVHQSLEEIHNQVKTASGLKAGDEVSSPVAELNENVESSNT